MRLNEAIERFDLLYPNAMPHAAKLKLLSDLDGRLYTEVLSRYEGAPGAFEGYTPETPAETPLLIPFPFDDIYLKALCAENDAVNGDVARYNNAALLLNAAWEQYVNYVNRTRRRLHPVRLRPAD